jgi:hypothetical protein
MAAVLSHGAVGKGFALCFVAMGYSLAGFFEVLFWNPISLRL